jgi:hypothetical protein
VGGAVLLLLSDTPVLRAQQGGQLPVFTARVELVRVDVQVVQRTGNPIIGLGLDDFQAWLDGHPRRVVSAQLISFEPSAPSSIDGPLRSPGMVPEDSRVFIIAIDQMGLSASAVMPVRDAIRKFLGQLRAEDMVGLYEFPYRAPRLNITHDHKEVGKALERVLGMREMNMGTFSLMPFRDLGHHRQRQRHDQPGDFARVPSGRGRSAVPGPRAHGSPRPCESPRG